MTTHEERQRLAAMGNTLRPDWPANSNYTHLTKEHTTRSYHNLAIALAWIATDPNTKTPARLLEPGPWWAATKPTDTTRSHIQAPGRCGKCGGWHAPSAPCDPPEHQRSHGRGAAQAKAALRQALTGGDHA